MNVSIQEQRKWYKYWKQIHEHLLKEGSQFAEPIGWHVVDGPSMIGFDTGEIRPGELGRWDLFYFLLQAGFGPPEDAATVVGLSLQQINAEEELAEYDYEHLS